ncbi:MAG: response regulator [Candidatus Omnitrophica bacterium]|nr:response regulator [Candidatus Omnitrophota bacterium]MBD3269159.1 response regulator [Candidatus Omnitrophota bacterium]
MEEKVKILVVDDEEQIVDFLCHFLSRFGITAAGATSGEEALRVFSQFNPQWIFLDIKMPGMDGFEILKNVKKIDPQVRTIMITGRNDEVSESQAKELGVYDYIIKPLDLDELKGKIKEYIMN